jgi:hypothetical protein
MLALLLERLLQLLARDDPLLHEEDPFVACRRW